MKAQEGRVQTPPVHRVQSQPMLELTRMPQANLELSVHGCERPNQYSPDNVARKGTEPPDFYAGESSGADQNGAELAGGAAAAAEQLAQHGAPASPRAQPRRLQRQVGRHDGQVARRVERRRPRYDVASRRRRPLRQLALQPLQTLCRIRAPGIAGPAARQRSPCHTPITPISIPSAIGHFPDYDKAAAERTCARLKNQLFILTARTG